MTTTSASAASSVASKPACSSNPAIRSESWTFIWQPNVSIRYLRATLASVPSVSFVDLGVLVALRTFAFALRFRLQHLTSGLPEAIADRLPSQHPRELGDAPVGREPPHGRPGPPPLDPLLDLKVRVGIRRDLRQVRDAEHLKRRSERPQLAPDDVGNAAADAGVDFVEDET